MPADEPSNAPMAGKPVLKDQDSAAAVLSDDRMDMTPGGGGLMGAGAVDPLSGTAAGQAGAATPNGPIDAHLPHDGGEATTERETQTRSSEEAAPTARSAV